MSACLQNDVLRRGIIVAAFLCVSSAPGTSIGLIEGLYGPESEVHLLLVEPHHLCEVVDERSVVLRRQVVLFTIHIATAGHQDAGPLCYS